MQQTPDTKFAWQEGVKNMDKSNWQAQVVGSGSATCLGVDQCPSGSWTQGVLVDCPLKRPPKRESSAFIADPCRRLRGGTGHPVQVNCRAGKQRHGDRLWCKVGQHHPGRALWLQSYNGVEELQRLLQPCQHVLAVTVQAGAVRALCQVQQPDLFHL